MQVPLLDLRLPYARLRDDVLSAVARVCDSQQFILGTEVEAFEREVAARIGVAGAIGMSSGTDAILAALMALGIGRGDEVVVPAFTFFATAGSVVRLGATPVFADVEPDTLTMDPASLERAISGRTRAVMPVHLFGQCADMTAIGALAAAHDLVVIEDAAQAIGAAYGGRPAGALGAAGCFSFFPSKNLGAFGDAGLVTTGDAALAARVRRLRNHGAGAEYRHDVVGGNFRLDALQAAILRVKLPHLDEWNDARRANAAGYRARLDAAGLTGRVRLPVEAPGRDHTYHQFVVRVPDRDRVRAHLAARGIGTAVYYPIPLDRQPCFDGIGRRPSPCVAADTAAREVLALPIFPGLTGEQQDHVVTSLGEALA